MQAQNLVQVHEFPVEFPAASQRLHGGRAAAQLGVRPKHGRDRNRLLEPVFEKIADIALVQLGQSVELQTRHAPLPGFHLGHGGAGDAKRLGGLGLRELARLPRVPEAAGEFKLRDRYLAVRG